jgi:hypothetical protein
LAKSKTKVDAPDPRAEKTEAADLAVVAAQIAEEFPLVLDRTSLVLLDVDPGHFHAFWTLAQADLDQTDAAFPDGGGPPETVIRLRRLRPDGGAEDLATLPLSGASRGDTRFSLPNDDAAYQAEIGLRNAGGGWLLLARSNQSRLPRPVGVPIPAWNGVETSAPGAAPDPDINGQPHGPQAGVAAPATELEIAIPAAAQGVTERAPEPGTRPARWVLDTASGRLSDARLLLAEPSAFSPAGRADWLTTQHPTDLAEMCGDSKPIQPWEPAIPADWHWPWPGQSGPHAQGEIHSALGTPGGDLHRSLHAGDAAAPSPLGSTAAPEPNGAATPVHPPGPISSFALGRGPESPLVEAEVLVHISARPGTLIELYGRPLRVGPAGHSTLRLPVTDTALLRLLLGTSDEPGAPSGG